MNRRDTKVDLTALFAKLRDRIPGLVLRTSLITGLPYEDDAAFEELCEFLRDVKIERAGVFPFSPEEGAAASKMEHVSMEEALRRKELVEDVQSDIIDAYNESCLGDVREVLCEGFDPQAQMYQGRSYAESPGIDGNILFTAEEAVQPGDFVNVRLTGVMDGELTGERAE
jgi:ribosomal protein S12 methylthiotransferase